MTRCCLIFSAGAANARDAPGQHGDAALAVGGGGWGPDGPDGPGGDPDPGGGGGGKGVRGSRSMGRRGRGVLGCASEPAGASGRSSRLLCSPFPTETRLLSRPTLMRPCSALSHPNPPPQPTPQSDCFNQRKPEKCRKMEGCLWCANKCVVDACLDFFLGGGEGVRWVCCLAVLPGP